MWTSMISDVTDIRAIRSTKTMRKRGQTGSCASHKAAYHMNNYTSSVAAYVGVVLYFPWHFPLHPMSCIQWFSGWDRSVCCGCWCCYDVKYPSISLSCIVASPCRAVDLTVPFSFAAESEAGVHTARTALRALRLETTINGCCCGCGWWWTWLDTNANSENS